MTRVVHLVIGPDEHGVVRHGALVARACGDVLVRASDVDSIPALPPCEVVHLSFTDRLLAPTMEQAGVAFARIAAAVADHGASLSVTLHDVPHDDSELQVGRRELYRSVMAAARGVVVNSRTELALIEADAEDVHSLRMIPLPLEPVQPSNVTVELPPHSVAVLGFVFPDRGHAEVIAALPPTGVLAAIGRASAGHEDLPAQYEHLAAGRWLMTGFVPDDALRPYLDAAAVPVAPNRRVTASASINTWIACGRRPLVPDSPYGRELAEDRPGAVRLYDPDDTDALRREIELAISDPSRTRLGPDVVRGPDVATIARMYTGHLAACAPERAVTVGETVVVPDNRWDLVPVGAPRPQPTVSVIVPYYDAQQDLDLVLAALSGQTYPSAAMELVVVDDGSPVAPDLSAATGMAVRVLRQEDQGFRAAQARNLGASAATGDVLVFLDGDTVPEPSYVAAMVDLPARCADVVTVGRRRHAVPDGLTIDSVREWPVRGVHVTELDEPRWLRDAYDDSGDLLRSDRRSYRYVLSAVLAVRARLFEELGGFDERFVGYGGEDWELAHRARTAGAVLAHVPDAVAWHLGPDWAGRGDDRERRLAKNPETATLAVLLPDQTSRGGGPWSPYPSIVVQCGTMPDVEALATVRSALAAGADCAFWFDEIAGPHAALVLATPGVYVGTPPDDVLARAWCRVLLHEATDLHDLAALAELAERRGEVVTRTARLRSTRSVRRAARWRPDDDDALAAWLFGRHDRSGLPPLRDLDLARALR